MEKTVQVGADRVWLDDDGGAGATVVLVHPGIHDSTVWDPVLPLLDGFRLVRYDARGFGRSPVATEEFGSVEDLATVVDALGTEQVHLVGNSMGGLACLGFALDHPGRVASLTLLAPGIRGYPWPDEDEAIEAEYAAAAESGDRDAMLDVQRRVWLAAGADDRTMAQLGAAYDADLAQDDLQRDDPEQWSRIGSITAPAAIIIGELDIASMVTGSTDLAAAIPGAELVRLPGVDHLPSLRDPQTVAAVVRRTVARAESR